MAEVGIFSPCQGLTKGRPRSALGWDDQFPITGQPQRTRHSRLIPAFHLIPHYKLRHSLNALQANRAGTGALCLASPFLQGLKALL